MDDLSPYHNIINLIFLIKEIINLHILNLQFLLNILKIQEKLIIFH